VARITRLYEIYYWQHGNENTLWTKINKYSPLIATVIMTGKALVFERNEILDNTNVTTFAVFLFNVDGLYVSAPSKWWLYP
jgi:hypothetical protein